VGYYPIALDLTDRPVVVIGGGPVAERKVEGLLTAGAAVTVVSPTLTPRLTDLSRAGRIRHEARGYAAADLAGIVLAFVATDDPRVTEAVARDARAAGVLVNAADDPAHCDFILPAVLRRGDLVVAITTGGASPALARAVRERLEAVITDVDAELLALAAEVRREARAGSAAPDAAAWHEALGDDLRRLVAAGRRDEAKSLLRRRLGVA
jgi:precorrin-2 dehydrogenase/sirohydrochlorin ferrochelatase